MRTINDCKENCSNYMKKGCGLLYIELKQKLLFELEMFHIKNILNWNKMKKDEIESCEKFEQN